MKSQKNYRVSDYRFGVIQNQKIGGRFVPPVISRVKKVGKIEHISGGWPKKILENSGGILGGRKFWGSTPMACGQV